MTRRPDVELLAAHLALPTPSMRRPATTTDAMAALCDAVDDWRETRSPLPYPPPRPRLHGLDEVMARRAGWTPETA